MSQIVGVNPEVTGEGRRVLRHAGVYPGVTGATSPASSRTPSQIVDYCKWGRILTRAFYYTWPEEDMEAGKHRLAGDTARAATGDKAQAWCRKASALEECVANLRLDNVIPADSYLDRAGGILGNRERIKRKTIQYRRLLNRSLAA